MPPASPLSKACAAYDYVLSPTSPMPAFAAELPSPTNDPLRPLEHIAFTVPFNMSEQPAASVNCGYTSGGLPIGLQIAGQRFDDLGMLAALARVRAIASWPQGRGPCRQRPESAHPRPMTTDSLGNPVSLREAASLGA